MHLTAVHELVERLVVDLDAAREMTVEVAGGAEVTRPNA